MRQNTRLVELVDAALEASAVSRLGAISPAESVRLTQLRRVASSLGVAWYEAPLEMARKAKDAFPADSRSRIRARILGRDLGLAGARSGQADHAHLVYDLQGHRARVMIERETKGWRVYGKVDADHWLAELGGQAVECVNGTFEFSVEMIDDAVLRLESNEAIYELSLTVQA